MGNRFGHDVPAICFVSLVPTPAGQHRVSKGFGDDSVTGYILLVFQ